MSSDGVLAKLECGNYGEDTIRALKLDDGNVVVEYTRKDGRVERTPIAPTDTLRVSGAGFGGNHGFGLETDLMVVSRCGSSSLLATFELSSFSGGVSDDDAATFARTIAAAAGASVNVIPTRWPTQSPAAPAPPPPAPPAPEPPKQLLADRDGVACLASIVGGDNTDETLRVLRLADGTVTIENAATGAAHPILPTDTLIVLPYVFSNDGGGGIWTLIEIGRGAERLRVAGFYCRGVEKVGPDTPAVHAFAKAAADAAGCTVDLRDLIWD